MSDVRKHEVEFTVQRQLGLHARPASQFVVAAGRFESEISVGRGQEWVDGRSVLSLLSLAASNGTRLRIRAVGVDAVEAVQALGEILKEPVGGVDAEPVLGGLGNGSEV
ncbi:MAG: HPr family phosphocarrier protein [Myxococcales bacterium]|nr:HPr family phosphocarrier protein [Myxococcales bacterium]